MGICSTKHAHHALPPAPPAPVISSVVAGDTTVQITFSTSAQLLHMGFILVYTIQPYIAGVGAGSCVNTTESPCILTNLNNGTEYTFKVRVQYSAQYTDHMA